MSKFNIFSLLFFSLLLTVFASRALAAVPALGGRDILSGREISVNGAARGMVVVFLSAKCPCSMSHIGEVSALAREFTEFRFVGVHSNMDESEDLAKGYFAGQKLPFPVIQDREAAIADRFNAAKTPHAFVLTDGPEPVFQGGMSDSKDCADSGRKYLREALTDLRAGRPPRERSVRTLGCAISRRKGG